MENMKLVLAYTTPKKEFDEETAVLVKLQIDNSLELGWEILLFTNFPYEYGGVKATVVPDLWVEWDKESNKILVINYLLGQGFLKGEFWYHDFDCYQNHPFKIEMTRDLLLTHYTYKEEFNGGCFFFRDSAKDIFQLWSRRIFDRVRPRADEKVLTRLILEGQIAPERFLRLDPSYNITQRFVNYVSQKAEKPLKMLHFHAQNRDYQTGERMLDVFYPLMSKRLKRLFDKYEIK